jgi:hypothetical protein
VAAGTRCHRPHGADLVRSDNHRAPAVTRHAQNVTSRRGAGITFWAENVNTGAEAPMFYYWKPEPVTLPEGTEPVLLAQADRLASSAVSP